MLVKELFNPNSIVIVGASNDITKPGGRVLKHVKEGNFSGNLFVVNPKDEIVQGIIAHKTIDTLPNVDLAIIAIAAKFVPETIELLAKNKKTKAFIVVSAGFSEIGHQGKILENQIVEICNTYGASLIGPNCIGVLTPAYKGTFTGPIPKLDPNGIDFVSGSGATAVFILEQAVPMGLTFASLFSVGNSAQIGVEDIIKYWDENFDPQTSSKVKMFYIEQVNKPDLLLKHASSLIKKGCKIAAIKSGTTDAGSRAVSSHTGALAGSDMAVDALFRKAGIFRCKSKQELVYAAAIFMHKELKGENIAIVTHAGGPGVMLTDTLTEGGLKVPELKGNSADELLSKLFHGSSVANPIDFLATGTAEQLEIILDYVDNKFDNIDGSIVIFGTPGLFDVTPVYDVLHKKMHSCKKPIFPVLPSLVQAKNAIEHFVNLGHQFFPDEVILGKTLAKIYHTAPPQEHCQLPEIDSDKIRNIIQNNSSGYLPNDAVFEILNASKINTVKQKLILNQNKLEQDLKNFNFPIVMKVVGPIHKSDIGGVKTNINSIEQAQTIYNELMKIPDAKAVIIQEMLKGTELFLGAIKENNYGHLILCGLGGIFVEILKDIVSELAPVNHQTALNMINKLKSKKIFEGARGCPPIDKNKFADIIVHLSALLHSAPEIAEMDINPLIAGNDFITVVDARIKIEK